MDIALFSFGFIVCFIEKSISMELLVEFGHKRLANFKGIGSQEVLHWNTDSAMLLHWSGTVNSTTEGIAVNCPDEFVHLIVRKNGIPIPNPLNASIPEGTLVNFTDNLYFGSYKLSPKKEFNHNITIPPPLVSSEYFTSAFLPKRQEQISVQGLTQDCRYYSNLKVYRLSPNLTNTTEENVQTGLLIDSPENHTNFFLERKVNNLFNVNYKENTQNLTEHLKPRFYWDIVSVTDSGGTMMINLNFKAKLDAPGANLTILSCLKSPENEINSSTCFHIELFNNTEKGLTVTRFIPFPISGRWRINFELQCEGINSTLCSNIYQTITLSVSLQSCIEGCQSSKKQGSCGLYRTDDILFSACACKVGWRGIGCTDGTEALSYSEQLLHTLLLTLSNLLFIACVVLAIYRKFYTEALVYFFVFFMSTFYHACDQPGVAVYCIMPYNTLQFSDFLGSITAIWVTLIALAKFSYRVESFCHVIGCLGLAVGVSLDRFNVWTTIVPAALGVILVLLTWIFKCRKRKVCYPGKKKSLFSVLPGVICAGTGLSLFAFVETNDNYYIVHSMWHILMASAVLFLLPIGPKNHTKGCKITDSSSSSPELINRNGVIFDIQDDEGFDNDVRV